MVYDVEIIRFKLLKQYSSRFRNKLSSSSERSSGIVDNPSLATVKSKRNPIISVLITGMYASGKLYGGYKGSVPHQLSSKCCN